MYKKLNHDHLASDHIEDGEVFPIGGTYPGAYNMYAQIDTENFAATFNKIRQNANRLIQTPTMQKWYQTLNIDLDFQLFCHMQSFNAVMQKYHPDIINVREHGNFYNITQPQKLSDAVAQKKCACTEYALLSQMYFQQQNIPTRYVSGELLTGNDFDDFEAHSFIAFENQGRMYVFDPANPYPNGIPRIAQLTGKKDNYFLSATSLFKKGEVWHYAGGDHGDFLHNLPQQSKKQTTLLGRQTRHSTTSIKNKNKQK